MKLNELLCLHKSDRQVLLVLFSLAAILLIAIWLLGNKEVEEAKGVVADSLSHLTYNTYPNSPASPTSHPSPPYSTPVHKKERFIFDPNTADSTQLLRLGLRPWQVRNIYKYRAKGGIYRKKEDFARLYGLTVKEYRELEPYIRISPDYLPASTLFDTPSVLHDTPPIAPVPEASASALPATKHYDSPPSAPMPEASASGLRYPVKLYDGETIDLNMSDTTQLRRVPGIGSYYARRIAQYGQRLGGYVSPDQLDEIEDFPASAKAFFVVSQPHPRQLSINRLSLNELKRHPYINYYQARAITEYRRQHGPIHSLDDLRLLPEFPPEAITRLKPYVSYD